MPALRDSPKDTVIDIVIEGHPYWQYWEGGRQHVTSLAELEYSFGDRYDDLLYWRDIIIPTDATDLIDEMAFEKKPNLNADDIETLLCLIEGWSKFQNLRFNRIKALGIFLEGGPYETYYDAAQEIGEEQARADLNAICERLIAGVTH